MYIEKLKNGNEIIHTTTTEFAELYKNNTSKQMAKIYGVSLAIIHKYIAVFRLRKNR